MKYILYILKAYFFLAYKIYWLNKIYTNRLFKELNKIPTIENSYLSKNLRKRIMFYTSQCYMSASWTCALRGEQLTQREKKNVIYLGAITPILDDLTDTLKLTSTEISYLLKNKKGEERPELKIARYLYEQLLSMHNKSFNDVFQEALIAQDASLQQLEERSLNENELKKIALDKGGMFTLLYRTVLETPLKKGEKDALITLGYVLQQINDMFDIYKDYINKQQTLFTNSKNITINYFDYKSNLSKLIFQFEKLDFEKKNIEKCLVEISTITSRGMVCLNQLLTLQKNESEFDIKKYTRKQLICDMEKVNNIKKSLFYSVSFYHQIKAANKK